MTMAAIQLLRDAPEKHQLLASSVPLKSGLDDVHVHSVSTTSLTSQSSARRGVEDPRWTPFAARWYFVIVPTSLSIVLALVVMLLHWLSEKRNGIASESSAMVGWKFAPTLIAVLYTQLAAMVLNALKRTEPYARLAKPLRDIPVARYTLLEKSKPWWTTFAHGFSRKRNPGSWSWAIILSSFAFILAIIGISPLSSALLSTRNVQVRIPTELNRLVVNDASPVRARSERSTYLRTTGALLQNYSTSPWATDDYFILPFWPGELQQASWTFETPSPQTWQAETTVFRNEYVCTALEMTKKDIYLRDTVEDFEVEMYNKTYLASILLESTNGCQLNLTYNATSNPSTEGSQGQPLYRREVSFASWTDIRQMAWQNEFDRDSRIIVNDECQMDEMILTSSPWMTRWDKDALLPNLTMTAYACRSEYTAATMPVRVLSTPSELTIEFDRERFNQTRAPVSPDMWNLTSLHELNATPEWYEYIPQPYLLDKYISGGNPPALHGAAALLGVKYDWNITAMMTAADIPQEAAKLRRRFFAETLRTSLDYQGASKVEPVSGERVTSERRILVNKPIAVALCALLSMSFYSFAALIWYSQLTRRPLNLYRDPSSVLGLCDVAVTASAVLSSFKSLDLAPRSLLKAQFDTRTFASSTKGLYEVDRIEDSVSDPSETVRSPASVLPALRLRNLFGLLTYVLALLVATAVLFKFAGTSALRQKFFIYRANIDVFGHDASFSPFAIIPTFLAVGITLWWDSIDQACRALQPLLAISHEAEIPSHGIGLSYASSFWLWASAKAAKNRHWLLSLITLTTFALQALTISMSALFQQNSVSMPHIRSLERSLEVRRNPLIATTSLQYGEGIEDYMFYDGNPAAEVATMMAESLIDLKGNWLYTALLQAALQGPEPSWSSDGWSFAPLDLSQLTRDLSTSRTAGLKGNDATNLIQIANLTVKTSAVRGQVQCSVIDDFLPAMWLATEGVGKNSTSSDRLYYPQITLEFENSTSQITPMAATPECCYNQSDPSVSVQSLDMITTLGYWTENLDNINVTTKDFTAKWVRGKAGFRKVGDFAQNPRMVFREPPAIQVLNCIPTFETADAEVTVDPSTGTVQKFDILGDPTPDAVAWSDNFQLRRSNESTYRFHNSTETMRFYHNITTSYGTLFMKSLLRAACLENINYSDKYYAQLQRSDYLFDKLFNMRDNSTGLNVDFMSYAALAQVGHDPTALLESDTLIRETQRIFSIFFQHYASGTVSFQNGSWAYQRIGSDLKLNEPIPHEALHQPPSKFEDFPLRNTERTVAATLYIQTEVLQMNAVAFWVSVGIMIWLVAAVVIFAAMQRHYLGGMQRNVECIADVLVLVAGSDRLLQVIQDRGVDAIIEDDSILTRLSWFRDPDGTMRWRIELVEKSDGRALLSSQSTAYAPVPGDDEGLESIVPGVAASRP